MRYIYLAILLNMVIFLASCSSDSQKQIQQPNSNEGRTTQNELFSLSTPGVVIGVIDGVEDRQSNGAVISGWACQKNVEKSISVHLYADGSAGQGTLVKGWNADSPNEPAVSDSFRCNTPNYLKHRFRIQLSDTEVKKFKNQKIYIYGISTTDKDHRLLSNSGNHTIPNRADEPQPNLPGVVVGSIEGVEDRKSEGAVIRGWACQENVEKSIAVHLYANGSAGQGALVKGWSADSPNEAAISDSSHCNTPNYLKHRFIIQLSDAEVKKFKNQKIYIYGISTTDKDHRLLSNSGSHFIPNRTTEPQPTSPGIVIGNIDRVEDRQSEGAMIRGWACQKNVEKSIAIHLYANDIDGNGTLVKGWSADVPSEAAISDSSRCNTPNYLRHRFGIQLSDAEVRKFKNQKIYVFGISTTDEDHRLLSKSGNYSIPNRTTDPQPTSILLSEVMKGYSSGTLTISSSENVVIDRSIDVGFIKLEGQLRCPESGNFTIKTDGILVAGSGAALICGSGNSPYQGKLNITLKNNRDLGQLNGANQNSLGGKGIVAMNGGVIQLTGLSNKRGWTKLVRHAQVGASKIYLLNSMDWEVGDVIVVGATGFDPHHSEQFTITGLADNNKTVELDRSLKYFHWGSVEEYANGKGRRWSLDERAEVANLTRNIKVGSAKDSYTEEKQIGAHMMIMGTGEAYIDSVEFHRVGQMTHLGRYPFHWHRRGNSQGQYIKNSSIHESYNRCVTIHGTQYALVERNTCYNHFGHGFFLEDGNETKNKILYNLGMYSRRVEKSRSLLISDFKSPAAIRFAAPATFWISNPDNDIYGNIASGSEGSGFWMAFQKSLYCDPKGCRVESPKNSNVFPISTDTLRFDNNVAHSAGVGITHDGAPDGALVNNPNNKNDRNIVSAHYAPKTTPVFRNLVTFKNSLTGIYYRGESAVYVNNVFADNGASAFFAYNQVVKDSLIVGFSGNHNSGELAYHYSSSTPRNRRWSYKFAGALMYDGPFYFENVHFANFSTEKIFYGGREVTPTPFTQIGAANRFVNSTRGLSFSPPNPYRKIHYGPTNWIDSWATGIVDLDGSLLGSPGTLSAPIHPLNDHASCVTKGVWNAYICNYDMGHLRFRSRSNPNYIEFSVIRNDGAAQNFPENPHSPLHSKFSMILNEGFSYSVEELDISEDTEIDIFYTSPSVGDISPLIHLKNLSRPCYLRNVERKNSLAELKTANSHAYYVAEGNNLYIKIKSTQRRKVYSEESPDGQGVVGMQCDWE